VLSVKQVIAGLLSCSAGKASFIMHKATCTQTAFHIKHSSSCSRKLGMKEDAASAASTEDVPSRSLCVVTLLLLRNAGPAPFQCLVLQV
jgi:hypothetical protein